MQCALHGRNPYRAQLHPYPHLADLRRHRGGRIDLAGGLNYVVTRSYNDDAIRQNLQSVARGHIAGIDDWVASKTQMVVALQDAALSADPVPALKTVAASGGFISVYVGYPDKSYKFADPSGVPPTYDPTARPGTSRPRRPASRW